MPLIRPEDATVKIPALIHLTRLGYRYLPRGALLRDPSTNILPEVFRAAVSRINGISFSDDAAGALLSEIRGSLDRDDLGKSFFSGLRNSWGGIRLLDFEHPENNALHATAELPYINGRDRFRPDITLFVNGLPLAFVEVKTSGPKDGVRSEYERMLRRARTPSLRRFINETQIMVFSNDAEYDENDLIPTRGAFYATSAYDDLVFNHFEESEREIFQRFAPAGPEETELILRDHHLEALADSPAFPASLSPETPTHKLLTSLFHLRRLLFFLQYGITYLETRDEEGHLQLSKHIMRYPQLFAVRFLEHQLLRGSPGGIWHVAGGARAALAAVQIRYLKDFFAAENTPVHFFYFAEDPAQARAVREILTGCGFPVDLLESESAFLRAGLWEEAHPYPDDPRITVICLQDFAPLPLPPPRPENQSARRVCFFDGASAGYAAGSSYPALLRASDPEAVLIEFEPDI